jgi:hypothetical protein
MKCYKHQRKYIRHCFPRPTPGLTPVPSRSDAPATWPPSFLRDLAGIPTADVRIYSYINQQINSDIDIQWKYIIYIYLHIYIYIHISTFFSPHSFLLRVSVSWFRVAAGSGPGGRPSACQQKRVGREGGQYCGW